MVAYIPPSPRATFSLSSSRSLSMLSSSPSRSSALSLVFGLLIRYFRFIGDVLSALLLLEGVGLGRGRGRVTVTVFLSASTRGGGSIAFDRPYWTSEPVFR